MSYQELLPNELKLSFSRTTTFMDDTMKHFIQCNNDHQRLMRALSFIFREHDKIKIPAEAKRYSPCTHIVLSNNNNINIKVSIANPVDASIDNDNIDFWAEFALFKNDEMICDDSFEFEDTYRFYSFDEIVKELLYLSNKYTKN